MSRGPFNKQMSIYVINFNSPIDISWSSFKNGANVPALNTIVNWVPGLTFQGVLDEANSRPAFLGSVVEADSILIYNEPNFVPVESTAIVPEGSVIAVYDSLLLQTPDSISDKIVSALNGPFSTVFGCPCTNVGPAGACTTNPVLRGLWAGITRDFSVNVGGVTGFLGPCFNPGKSMQVSAGIAPFFSVTAQVVRVRNFDRVKFLKVSSGFKECTQTMIITIIGQTCGSDNSDHGILTKFGVDVSMQASALGQNLFTEPKFCDNVDPAVQNLDCPVNGGCVQVFLPATYIEMTIEINLNPGDAITCATGSSKKLDWNNVKIAMNFNFTDRPEFYVPGIIINEDLRVQLESAMLQLTNGVMRNVISDIISDKLSPFINEFLSQLTTLTNFSFCVDFPPQSRIKCNSKIPPVLPAACDLCDECCLCLTRGDCGALCRQNCPCVVPFCKSLDRTIEPIWFTVFIIFVIIFIILAFIAMRIVIGIGR